MYSVAPDWRQLPQRTDKIGAQRLAEG